MVMQQQWFQSIVQLCESVVSVFCAFDIPAMFLCMCFGSSSGSITTSIVLLFNEIVINAHTWRAQLNYNMPILLNEKQFLMWRQTMTSILGCVRVFCGGIKMWTAAEAEAETKRIVCIAPKVHALPSDRIHIWWHFHPKKKTKGTSTAPLQTKCAFVCNLVQWKKKHTHIQIKEEKRTEMKK